MVSDAFFSNSYDDYYPKYYVDVNVNRRSIYSDVENFNVEWSVN